MANILRGLVSKNKRRYTDDGFNLDLSYIDCLPQLEGKLVAMSFPTEGKEAWYRNDAKDVRCFLEHQKCKGKGSYKVYNLTAERPTYGVERLGGSLSNKFMFEDHQVPSLLQMQDFCKDLDAFLGQNLDNFAAVHCKAGKGRTGVMCCAYLLYKKLARNAVEAMDIYARQRSKVLAGLTVPSQKRYVAYFCAVLEEQQMLAPVKLTMEGMSVSGIPRSQMANLTVRVACRFPGSEETICVTTMRASEEFVSLHGGTRYTPASPRVRMQPPPATAFSSLPGTCFCEGDVRVEVYLGQPSSKTLLLRTWFNTSFVSPGSYTLTADELDKGAVAVKSGTSLVLHLGQPMAAASASDSTADGVIRTVTGSGGSLLQPLHELDSRSFSLPSGVLVAQGRRDWEDMQWPEEGHATSQPHILEIHPDFSIPAKFRPPVPPPCPPAGWLLPTPAAAQQLLSSPGLSSCSCGTSVQELNDRLEGLLHDGSLPSVVKKLESTRRTQSVPISWSHGPAFSEPLVPIPPTLGLVRLRPSKSQHWYDDPEMHDLSAPTTPSLPRPPTSIDWQQSATTSVPATCMGSVDGTWFSSFLPGSQQQQPAFAPFQEGTASGADSPSHGAQMIKWMSSSWWLTMA